MTDTEHTKTPPPDGSGVPKPEQLMTVEEVCEWMQVTKDWVRDQVQAGRLPYVRLGSRRLRFRRSVLEEYLKDQGGEHQ